MLDKVIKLMKHAISAMGIGNEEEGETFFQKACEIANKSNFKLEDTLKIEELEEEFYKQKKQTVMANLKKLGTPELEKKINSGKLTGETLEEAKTILAARKAKSKKAEPVKAESKKKETPAPAKKKAAKKAAAAPKKEDKKTEGPREGTIRAFVYDLAKPKSSKDKIASVSYGEAKKAVLAKFTHRTNYYTSEFSAVIDQLKQDGFVTETKKPQYRTIAEEAK